MSSVVPRCELELERRRIGTRARDGPGLYGRGIEGRESQTNSSVIASFGLGSDPMNVAYDAFWIRRRRKPWTECSRGRRESGLRDQGTGFASGMC
jgi:hypothetical protein